MIDQRNILTRAIPMVIAVLLVAVGPMGHVSKGSANELSTASGFVEPQTVGEAEPTCRPSPRPRPVIRDLRANLYGEYLIVSGTVQNLTGDPNDWSVSLSGSIRGTTRVKSDGDFVHVTHYDYPYGEVIARALGPNGEESLRAIVEFYE